MFFNRKTLYRILFSLFIAWAIRLILNLYGIIFIKSNILFILCTILTISISTFINKSFEIIDIHNPFYLIKFIYNYCNKKINYMFMRGKKSKKKILK